MYYLLGMPLHDVAASLGIPVGTAKSRLHYALGAMRTTVTAEPAAAQEQARGGQLA
jgi:DNA-directed RNA polymerase specialized sigma24 family protein